MTPEQHRLAWELINDPPAGSKLAEAKEYGIDLTLLVSNLNLSVADRLRKLQAVAAFMEKVRSANDVKELHNLTTSDS